MLPDIILQYIDLACSFLHSLMSPRPLTWSIMRSFCNVFICPLALTAHLLTGLNPTRQKALKWLSWVTLEFYGFGLSWAPFRSLSSVDVKNIFLRFYYFH